MIDLHQNNKASRALRHAENALANQMYWDGDLVHILTAKDIIARFEELYQFLGVDRKIVHVPLHHELIQKEDK